MATAFRPRGARSTADLGWHRVASLIDVGDDRVPRDPGFPRPRRRAPLRARRRALGVTQLRVSQSLRTLEAKLGERLVHRTSRRVALTAAGERFLADVAPAHERLVAVLRGAAPQATLRIGLLASITAGPRLIELIRAFEQRHPGCSVEVK